MAGGKVYRVSSKRGVTYRIRLDYVDPLTGERRRPWETLKGITSEKEAERHLAQRIAELEGGAIVAPSRRTVGEVLVEWLNQYARSHVRPETLEDYESTIRNHVLPAFGTVPLQRLTTARVQQWEDTYHAAGHGTRTVQLAHLRLRQTMAYAVRMGYVSRNVVEDVHPPTQRQRKKATWNREERARFLAVATDSVYYPLWHVALHTGLRRGELIALRWDAVDLVQKVITVWDAAGPLGGRATRGDTKTAEGVRQVPFGDDLAQILTAHRLHQAETLLHRGLQNKDRLVLASTVGTIINPNNITREFHRLLAEVKPSLRPLTVHGLRHTFAQLALESGVPLPVVQAWLGHTRMSTTADFYIRMSPDLEGAAFERMQTYLKDSAQ